MWAVGVGHGPHLDVAQRKAQRRGDGGLFVALQALAPGLVLGLGFGFK